MSNELMLKDRIESEDTLGRPRFKHPSPFTRTQIIITDEFGRPLYETENQVVIGGSLFVLEKVFGVEAPLKVDYLNNIMGIATTGPAITEIYPKDTVVCLFGVGIGGAGDGTTQVHDVKFYEREIFDMVPFRVTDEALPIGEAQKYWFRKPTQDGKTEYYLKRFEKITTKALWADGEEGEDGSEVEQGVHETNRVEPIETFVESHLKITKKDIREYFTIQGDIESARINSIGLFTGILADVGNGEQDYKQVKLFSKLNIPNEILYLNKDLNIYYRVYAS